MPEEMISLIRQPRTKGSGGRKSVSEQAAPNAAPRQILVRLMEDFIILPTESSRK